MVWIWSSSVILFLLPNSNLCSKSVPFYCKIRKPDCSLSKYQNHICCPKEEEVVSSTTKNTDVTTENELGTDLSVVTNNTVITTGADGGGDDAKYCDPEQSEIFETQPSQIDQVFVKLSDDSTTTSIQLPNQVSQTEQKYAPKFCSKLRFNCNNKRRFGHACCRLPPAPEERKPVTSTTTSSVTSNNIVKPTRTTVRNGVRIAEGSVPFRRTSISRRPLLRKPLITSANRISVREKINSFDPKSAAVCRIINCARNKRHRCCQEPSTTTTVTTTTAGTSTTSSTTTSTMSSTSIEEVGTYTMMPELEEQAVTSSSPLIASETIEETTIRIADEGDMMNGANDKVSDDPGENPNKMMYTSTEENEFYETSPETTTDDTDILPRSSMSYEKEQVTTKDNLEKVDDEERTVEPDDNFYDTDIIITTTEMIQKSEEIYYYSDYQTDDSDYDQRESKHLNVKSNTFSPDNYNALVKTILVPNQIAPRVAAECFRFDCLSQPSHHCCSPHPAIKRHTDEYDYNDDDNFIDEDVEDESNFKQYVNSRVTATITRVLKSISWL